MNWENVNYAHTSLSASDVHYTNFQYGFRNTALPTNNIIQTGFRNDIPDILKIDITFPLVDCRHQMKFQYFVWPKTALS